MSDDNVPWGGCIKCGRICDPTPTFLCSDCQLLQDVTTEYSEIRQLLEKAGWATGNRQVRKEIAGHLLRYGFRSATPIHRMIQRYKEKY